MTQRLIKNIERGNEEKISVSGKIITSWNLTIVENDKTSIENMRHNDLLTLYAGPYIYHQPDPKRPLVFSPSAHADMSRLMFASYYVLTELSKTLTDSYFVSYYLDGKLVCITLKTDEARKWLKTNHRLIVFILKNYPEDFDYVEYTIL